MHDEAHRVPDPRRGHDDARLDRRNARIRVELGALVAPHGFLHARDLPGMSIGVESFAVTVQVHLLCHPWSMPRLRGSGTVPRMRPPDTGAARDAAWLAERAE